MDALQITNTVLMYIGAIWVGSRAELWKRRERDSNYRRFARENRIFRIGRRRIRLTHHRSRLGFLDRRMA